MQSSTFIEYVPAVKTGTIQELDAASQQQLLAIHQQYLLTRSQQVLGDTVGVNFKNHRGVAATERLVTIADWGWRIIDGGFEPWAGVSDDDRINTLPGSPGYRTITYFSGWTELHSGRQGDTLIQHPYTSIEISAQIERLIRNQEVTRSFTAYDSSGGSPFYAGAEAFFAHKNTRIAAGVAGIALVVFTGGLSAPFVVGGISKNALEMGTFKVPALRNVALTAPYMHDGRFQTLEQVVDHYSSGIKAHVNLNPELKNADGTPRNFNFSPTEKAALVTFLRTLTDEKMMADVRFSSPFK